MLVIGAQKNNQGCGERTPGPGVIFFKGPTIDLTIRRQRILSKVYWVALRSNFSSWMPLKKTFFFQYSSTLGNHFQIIN